MASSSFTVGMAGHIDHGKTTLTKSLTGVDTDRLKQEKERNISIELGYAPLHLKDGRQVSVIDVPGHERFIRQMIAGVAGIDLVILVIAADEGVMPQTKEHLQILQFLGVSKGIVAITKTDSVDEEMLELVKLDICESLTGTVFESVPLVFVDSISNNGIEELKEELFHLLQSVSNRDRYGAFRLPIDQVFTVQGIGTIVRGTIYEGSISKNNQLTVLPINKKGKARNIQVHRQNVTTAYAGQRIAINLAGIDHHGLKRGDVLVNSNNFLVTQTIDVAIQFVDELKFPLKQRSPVKLHSGTAEVMGKIVFFDRNSVDQTNDEILCQIRLNEPIVVRRGDRFILRRPTPVETIGGGWIIDPNGEKYRFGKQTMDMLRQKTEGTPEQRLDELLASNLVLNQTQIIQYLSINAEEVKAIINNNVESGKLLELANERYIRNTDFIKVKAEILSTINQHHEKNPMRQGINKAEIIQVFADNYPTYMVGIAIQSLIDDKKLVRNEQFLRNTSFHPYLPTKWKARMEQIINELKRDSLQVTKWEEYVKDTPLSKEQVSDLGNYLLVTNQAYQLTGDMYVHKIPFEQALKHLQNGTGESFEIKQAKDILQVSRKYLVPFLELLDRLNLTTRNGSERIWK